MKRYRVPVVALAVIVCLALSSYIFASGILEEYKHRAPQERNPEYVSLNGLREYVWQGYEYREIWEDQALAVVYVTGTSLEGMWKSTGQHLTQIKAKVEEVLYGDLMVGDEIYLGQWGNSKVMYLDTIIYVPGKRKTTGTDDCGGFFQKGERLLVLVNIHTMSKEDADCGLHLDHVCTYVTEYCVRTVEKDGTLGYRKNSAYAPDSDTYAYLPFKLPYAQYNTIQEVRDAIPGMTVKQMERCLGRKLSETERVFIAKNNYKNALSALCSGNIVEYITSLPAEK